MNSEGKKEKSSCPEDDEMAHPLLNSSNISNQNTQGGGGRKQTPLERFADSILNFDNKKTDKGSEKDNKKTVETTENKKIRLVRLASSKKIKRLKKK
ncbi:hypothetical protein LCGC14_1160990 [marine sediment metagenome]|uniref:Uncharacterized protein n=1 Tax=marine sediment metagenome TaxID=412755 RepID=A0A0F9PAY2_9ZZZZ